MGMSNSCVHAKVSLRKMPEYRTRDFGIPLVLVDAAMQEVCEECKHIGEIHIPNAPGLIAAAVVYRASLAQKLTGKEIRFLRKSLQMSSRRLAELLSITAETLSRCENDKAPMNPTTEKVLRVLAASSLASAAPAIPFDPKDIVSMKIASMRTIGEEETEMKFGLVKLVNMDKTLSEAYLKAA